jgi:hypothetical protein
VETIVSGVKSFSGSKGRLGYRLALIAWLVKLMSSVLPSGGALATMSAAMLPPAPGRFSTTTTGPGASQFGRERAGHGVGGAAGGSADQDADGRRHCLAPGRRRRRREWPRAAARGG